jgi:hypothetical protein
MPTRRFERIALAQILVGGCAVVFACLLIKHAQAQPSTPSVVPSDEVTSPANEETPRRTARSHHRRRASVYWAAPAFGPPSYRIPADDVFLCRLPLYYPMRPATVWDVWNQTSALFWVRPKEFGHALLSCRS